MINIRNLRNFSSQSSNVMNMKIKDNIGIVEINNPFSSVNVINQHFSNDLWKMLDIYHSEKLDGIIFKSSKKDNFIAGADIEMLKKNDEQELHQILKDGHKLINHLSNINSVSAIHGSCLGGGLEFALACKYRIASDSNKTILGLPEVKLGLLPGMGGTQLFPKVVGLKNALPKILTGSNITSKKAKQIGLVDFNVNAALLDSACIQMIKNPIKVNKPNYFFDKVVKNIMFSKAKKDLSAKTKNLYPGPIKILDILEKTYSKPPDFDYEKKLFMELLQSSESQSLIKIFEDTNKNKDKYKNYQDHISKISIIGSGLMGTGIAKSSIRNINVNIKDSQLQNIDKSIKNIYQYIDDDVKKGKIDNYQADKLKFNVISNSSYENSDVIIEAVSESMDIKKQVFEHLDSVIDSDTVLASNTSSLSINEIAKFSKYPERVIGMHYFSPVEKMPLLEIITGDKTDTKTISKAISVGKKQNKVMIIVKDVPGFYINRCLTPYMNEALHLLEEGYKPSYIDQIMTNKGFPVGPFALMDEVGLDICSKVNDMLKNELDGRIQDTNSDVTNFLLENQSLGKKTAKGFYSYKGRKKTDNPEILKLIHKNTTNKNTTDKNTKDEIFERLLFKFINEADHCLKKNINKDKIDGDIGAIYGTGFPPYLGGPFSYLDNIGRELFYQKLDILNKSHNNRFNYIN